MSHHTRTRADLAAWAPGTAITPAELDGLDAKIFKSVNGDDGGLWNPSSAIEIGGKGLKVSGPLIMNGEVTAAFVAQNFPNKSVSNFTKPVRDIAWTGTQFVAVGGPTVDSGGNDVYVAKSLDGLTWTDVPMPLITAQGEAYSVDAITGLAVIGSEPSSGDWDNGHASTDGGDNWNQRSLLGTTAPVASVTIYGVKYFAPANIWLIGGDGRMFTNTTASIQANVSATERTVPAGLSNRQLNLFAYRTSTPLCVVATTEAADGDVMTSPDGVTWTGRTLAASMTARGLVYSEYWGVWIIVGTGGAMQRSTDGATWTGDNFVASNDLLGIAALGPLLMILVGPAANARTIWSLDGGANWYEGARLALGTNPKLKTLDDRFVIFDETRCWPGWKFGSAVSAAAYT